MINLLPDDVKKEIRAARTNVVLLQYNFYTLLTVLIMLGLCLIFYLFLNSSLASAEATRKDNKDKIAALQAVRTAAEAYRNDLVVADKIFQNSINFSDVVFEITKLLPDGVVLDNIDLTRESFDKAVLFAAHAKSSDHATMLKDSFEKSELFDNVFLQNLSVATSPDGEDSELLYPISFTVSAVLKKKAGLW